MNCPQAKRGSDPGVNNWGQTPRSTNSGWGDGKCGSGVAGVRYLRRAAIAALSAIGLLAASQAGAASLTLVPLAAGLAAPVLVTTARDGSQRLFIVEQGGIVKVLRPRVTSPSVFLDIRSKVLSGGERGLLGLTFHPGFASNRRFFVDYTRTPDGATVVAEYRVSAGDPDVADASSETVLLEIPQPFANHNGGMVEFGPDGFLYIATGDGGSGNDPGNRAQETAELLGKILRIDVDHPSATRPYSSPASNPFFGSADRAAEIYASGFRNPWRFSFDRATGGLYAGDVGERTVEEIDIVTRGGNYGWRIWEGARCTGNDAGLCTRAGFVFPIATYDHAAGRCAVTGGYVYRGTRATLPQGSYVHGDYCTGEILVLETGASRVALETGLNISSFGEDESGELYVVGHGGTVHRIAAAAGPPDAATSLAPRGAMVTTVPTYTWNAVAGATFYYLWVNDGSAQPRITRWYSASAAGCGLGGGTCAVTPDTVLAAGAGRWWVRTWNADGYGPWSVPLDFRVGGPPGPSELYAPTGTTSDDLPLYIWAPVVNATHYHLWVNDRNAQPLIDRWYSSADAACGVFGFGQCAATPPIRPATGPVRAWIRTWSPDGYGPWSAPLDFVVSLRPPAPISPSGTLATATPTYTWGAAPGATYYYLWVNDGGAAPRIDRWYSAAEAGCAAGAGTCAVTPQTPLAAGTGRWWVRAWNPHGYGPWGVPRAFTR